MVEDTHDDVMDVEAADEIMRDDEDDDMGGEAEMDGDEASDADSDYLELQADIARLDASRQAFLSEHLGPDYRPSDEDKAGASGHTRRRRGPRKAAEPTGEVKLRLQHAHQLFMDHRYEDALDVLHEIIRVNAETHAAWTLLASINEDLGRRNEAIMAMVFAAHLEPKRVTGWLSTADYALAEAEVDQEAHEGGEEEDEVQNRRLQNLQIARLCYSGAIRADKDNIAARLGKANVCLEFGQATNAATEYVRVLKRRPYSLQVIRNLAEASYDSVRGEETILAAIAAYRRAISHLQKRDRARKKDEPQYQWQLPEPPDLQFEDGEVFSWMDVTIYVELFAAISNFDEAVTVLKSLARWMLGRGAADEVAVWERHAKEAGIDDCEWDRKDEPRRILVPGFQRGHYPAETYGEGLPIDLRAKLAIYRLKLGHEEEAIEHLSWIDPQDANTTEAMRVAPHLLKDVGVELYVSKRSEMALQYLDLYRMLNRPAAVTYNQYGDEVETTADGMNAADEDAEALVMQGKCNLDLHDHAAAEECFLAAIEADDENVDARFELAKMYEKAQEKEQAFILVNEALSLEAMQKKQNPQHQGGEGEGEQPDGQDNSRRPRGHAASLETAAYRVFLDGDGKVVRRRRKYRKDGEGGREGPAQRRQRGSRQQNGGEEGGGEEGEDYEDGADTAASRRRRMLHRRVLRGHAKRFFASPAAQASFEAETSARLRARYQLCQEVKARADGGDSAAAAQWMDAAQELIDDFRSFREFYTWDKYVQFLGYNNFLDRGEGASGGIKEAPHADASQTQGHNRDLTALAARLQQNLAPAAEEGQQAEGAAENARFVPTLRREFRGIPIDDWLALFLEYALRLAHAGRAAEAYAVCQSAHDSTVYRQYDSAFLIHLTWAACAVHAGDEQTCVAVARYFMRDRPFTTDCYRLFATMCRLSRSPSAWFSASPAQKYILRQIRQRDEVLAREAEAAGEKDGERSTTGLDACLLVTYGHILFASMSFHFALNYYQRALALDPDNPVISLCIGLSYVHWALKRQAENRQYLLSQGLNFLFRYVAGRTADTGPGAVDARREAYYNVARTYHLLGLHALAAEFYGKVLLEDGGKKHQPGEHCQDLRTEAAYNLRTYYLLAGNQAAAMAMTKEYLVL